MYGKHASRRFGHPSIVLIDILLIQAALLAAWKMAGRSWRIYDSPDGRLIAILLIFMEIGVLLLTHIYDDVLTRGWIQELKKTLKQVVFLGAGALMLAFMIKGDMNLPLRSVIDLIITATVILYVGHSAWKLIMRRFYANHSEHKKMLLVCSQSQMAAVIRRMKKSGSEDFDLVGHFEPGEGCEEKVLEFLQTHIVDELLFVMGQDKPVPWEIVHECELMGYPVHIGFESFGHLIGQRTIEEIGGISVVSSCVRLVTMKELFIKRSIDVAGAIVGLILTGIVFIFVAPAIYLSDPGPIFFVQNRIGKNGRVFHMYKFRSMYKDAERRKKELMEKNEMQGLMFKMEHDPRIIGSGPDGTRHGVGWFIRTYSIDEMPQFFNVLKGDMSLVGTRPPTIDEWEQYEPHHKVRMRIRPGITGMWQVSGRSDVKDFEEVVRMDSEYIRSWTPVKDMRIILKTVVVVCGGEGAK